ncbi:type II toxin-antitoxin system prevent-host-death family antitoxin [Sphingoaurantiacus capsulatus]|uniref:Type II toxin-antitoxin system prevent-host-death family antitoxin n=1 Tax=Sphingoaurantiacus capsulatus TaxID=1771310 RepID=A0ABV7XDZ9_9SPHN
MRTVTGEQLQKRSGEVRAEARRAPVEVTYHGRPELIVMSVEDYAVLRINRKLAAHRDEMAAAKLERIAGNRMDAAHADLDALMD